MRRVALAGQVGVPWWVLVSASPSTRGGGCSEEAEPEVTQQEEEVEGEVGETGQESEMPGLLAEVGE